VGRYLDAADRYAKLALKPQANCREALDPLTKWRRGRYSPLSDA